MHQEVTNRIFLSIWWAWQWRVVVATLAGSLVFSFVIGFFGGILGLDEELLELLNNLVSFAIGVYASFYFLRFVLLKEYRDFSITIYRKEH